MTSAPRPLTLRTVEVDLAGRGLTGLLAGLEPSAAWVREGDGLIGLGEAARTTASGPRRFERLAQVWDELGTEHSDLVAFVSVTFSAESEYTSLLVVPEVLIRTDDDGGARVIITDDGQGDTVSVLARHGLVLEGRSLRLAGPGTPPPLPRTALQAGTRSQAQYLSAVTAGLSAIGDGTVEKLVLARDVVVSADAPVPAGPLLARLAADYPQTWTYRVGQMLGATPEMLVQLRGDRLFSRVLAGTVDHAASAQSLLADGKQRREHHLAVASLRDQLAPLTDSLQSAADPRLLELPNVYHLATDVTGTLARTDDDGLPGPLEVAYAAHPTAAVCGTPTGAAGQLIEQLEGLDRGPFAGPIGWMDAAGHAEFGIALRGGVLEEEAHRVRLYAGAGIVAGSDPKAELAETESKLRPMLSALGLPYTASG
ncbi:isochorismate synthase [Nesterenkonia populi]